MIDNDIKNAMKERMLGLIRKPAIEQKKKKAPNKAWLALLGFNGMMFFLDIISGITVGMLVSPLYGALTFLSGFLALFLHEQLFTNAHANMSQKWIAIGGGIIAVLSTLGIGLLAGAANVFGLAGIVSVTTLEMSMIAALIVAAFVHGILWGVYYFTDPTHVAEMKRLVNIGWREQQAQGVADAKEDLVAVKAIAKELDDLADSGEAELLLESYKNLRGVDLVTPTTTAPMVADPKMPFLQKQQVAPPLSLLNKDGEK